VASGLASPGFLARSTRTVHDLTSGLKLGIITHMRPGLTYSVIGVAYCMKLQADAIDWHVQPAPRSDLDPCACRE
jgi:hypothetical protein